MTLKTPNPAAWLWYAFTGKLGPDHKAWVLFDVTGHTRWPRQAFRALIQITVPAVAVLSVLGFSWVAFGGVACGGLLGFYYSLILIDQAGDRRLVKNGYEPGTLQRALRDRYQSEHSGEIDRYLQTYRNPAS